MKKIRIILGALLIPHIILGLMAFKNPMFDVDHSDLAFVLYFFGIPTLALNVWAWDAPQIIRAMFDVGG